MWGFGRVETRGLGELKCEGLGELNFLQKLIDFKLVKKTSVFSKTQYLLSTLL
jgi:hypothetical protein